VIVQSFSPGPKRAIDAPRVIVLARSGLDFTSAQSLMNPLECVVSRRVSPFLEELDLRPRGCLVLPRPG